MNVIKIVVDEKPTCSECIFLNSEHNYHCILTLKNVAMPHVNPQWCPLVVEDECPDCGGSGAVMVWDGQAGEGIPDPCFRCKGTGKIS
jgi:hypothetical protein